MNTKKVAIVVQRYGDQINGGAEVHARMIAEKLSEKYDITILTSRAVNYHTWDPVLPKGDTLENGIKIIRFDHPPKSNPKEVHLFNRRIRGRRWYQKLYRFLGRPEWYLNLFPETTVKEEEQKRFFELQGPALYGLPQYLAQHQSEYVCFIFFTYLYYPTAIGMPLVGHKSIFIPTIHDEPPVYFSVFKKIIPAARWIFFNTRHEMSFSEKLFDLTRNKKDVVAVGLEKPENQQDPCVLTKYAIQGEYIIYVGRIDQAKGCDTLIEYFLNYVNETKSNISLVMVGNLFMKSDTHPQIIYTGFICDADKIQLMKQAKALVVPSRYESLSLVLLESFNHKVPVIVNKECDVLNDHITISGGGWSYKNSQDFAAAINMVLKDEAARKNAGLNGYRYVQENYQWDIVLEKFENAIRDIDRQSAVI